MDAKTKGAWLVHHTQKLQHVTGGAGEFENIAVAGKMGILLSTLASTDQSSLTTAQVNALARASNLSVALELPSLLQRLEGLRLIQQSTTGVEVLAVTSAAVLAHTATAFDTLTPTGREQAVIDIAEHVSSAPLEQAALAEYVGDTYKLSTTERI